jgi:hypothetical protein
MASARELLEQADALMRKNRSRGDDDIPLLTDAVALVPVSVAVTMSSPGAAPAPMAPAAPPADVPLLTDVVEQPAVDFGPSLEPPAALVAIMEGDPSDWLVMDTVDPASHSITGRAPDTLAAVPPMTLKAAGSQATPPPMGSQPRAKVETSAEMEPDWASLSVPLSDAAAAPPPMADALRKADPAAEAAHRVERNSSAPIDDAPEPDFMAAFDDQDKFGAVTEINEPAASGHAPTADRSGERAVADEERWRALAEQVSMQVLQRLDLFTDTGLKEQLARRLEPIVERASAELVGEITAHVGRLIRTYVSEAIEREIADWKRDQH